MSNPAVAVHIMESEQVYDGTAIRSLWAYTTCNVQGDSIVAFIGPCDIPDEHIVDSEDLKAGATIYSPMMLHWIVEHFDNDLMLTIHRQRMLIVLCMEWLQERLQDTVPEIVLRRSGDDLFVGERKLSISIATTTRVSTKIHVGVNIRTEGVPVPAAGLAEWSFSPQEMARDVAEAYATELTGMQWARSKVRGVE